MTKTYFSHINDTLIQTIIIEGILSLEPADPFIHGGKQEKKYDSSVTFIDCTFMAV